MLAIGISAITLIMDKYADLFFFLSLSINNLLFLRSRNGPTITRNTQINILFIEQYFFLFTKLFLVGENQYKIQLEMGKIEYWKNHLKHLIPLCHVKSKYPDMFYLHLLFMKRKQISERMYLHAITVMFSYCL